jgi:hypothetical protein
MNGAVLLDTVVASYLSPLKRDSPKRRRFQHALVGKVAILSAQTAAEMYFWAERRR